MNFKNSIKLFIALVLIFSLLLFLHQKRYFSVVEKITGMNFLILTLLTLLSYFVSGYQMYYLVKKQNNISISLSDTLLLPISMSLFSYVIPTNGGLLYSVYFLKKKYNIDSTKGFSIGIFSIYISFIISGVFGIISCFLSEMFNFWILTLSIGLILSPIFVNIFNHFISKFQFKNESILHRIQFFMNSMLSHSNDFITNKSVFVLNIFINILYFAITLISYQYLNLILKINLPLTSVFLILIISRVSSLVRFLPGNIGIEELYMASIFKIVGKDPSIGLIVSIILRITTIILFIPLGIIHSIINLKYINFLDLKSEFQFKRK